jgi:uncharacterized metal-binding protein
MALVLLVILLASLAAGIGFHITALWVTCVILLGLLIVVGLLVVLIAHLVAKAAKPFIDRVTRELDDADNRPIVRGRLR